MSPKWEMQIHRQQAHRHNPAIFACNKPIDIVVCIWYNIVMSGKAYTHSIHRPA